MRCEISCGLLRWYFLQTKEYDLRTQFRNSFEEWSVGAAFVCAPITPRNKNRLRRRSKFNLKTKCLYNFIFLLHKTLIFFMKRTENCLIQKQYEPNPQYLIQDTKIGSPLDLTNETFENSTNLWTKLRSRTTTKYSDANCPPWLYSGKLHTCTSKLGGEGGPKCHTWKYHERNTSTVISGECVRAC